MRPRPTLRLMRLWRKPWMDSHWWWRRITYGRLVAPWSGRASCWIVTPTFPTRTRQPCKSKLRMPKHCWLNKRPNWTTGSKATRRHSKTRPNRRKKRPVRFWTRLRKRGPRTLPRPSQPPRMPWPSCRTSIRILRLPRPSLRPSKRKLRMLRMPTPLTFWWVWRKKWTCRFRKSRLIQQH